MYGKCDLFNIYNIYSIVFISSIDDHTHTFSIERHRRTKRIERPFEESVEDELGCESFHDEWYTAMDPFMIGSSVLIILAGRKTSVSWFSFSQDFSFISSHFSSFLPQDFFLLLNPFSSIPDFLHFT